MDSKGSGPAVQTFSMASMPLIAQTDMGDGTNTGAMAPPAKRLLNFASSETPTAPPTSRAPTDQITVYDTAVQTATMDQIIQESASATRGATGTSLQMRQVSKHPNAIKRHEERQLRQVSLPKELAQGKQLQP